VAALFFINNNFYDNTFFVNMNVFLITLIIIGYLLYKFHRDPPRIRKLGGNVREFTETS